MELEKMMTLIDKLARQTASGSIKWAADSADTLSTVVGKHKISITEHIANGSDPDYYICFYGDDGKPLEAISDVDLREVASRAFHAMRSLYHSARRSSTGVGQIVKDIIEELDDLEPF
jgi:hypothetical protein